MRDVYSCSKEELVRGWELLSNAYAELTCEKEIGFLISCIHRGIADYEANFENCRRKHLRKMFKFSATSILELEPLELDYEESATLLELLDSSGINIRRARLLFNARE